MVSSTEKSSVVSNELRAPPPLIATATDAKGIVGKPKVARFRIVPPRARR